MGEEQYKMIIKRLSDDKKELLMKVKILEEMIERGSKNEQLQWFRNYRENLQYFNLT